jgi:hypothetical protein
MYFALPDGRELGLDISRGDERQRRLRLHLAESADCWDYAPLIDVVCREPGFAVARFTGKSAAQWLADLRARDAADCDRFKAWYEGVVSRYLATLAHRQRVPDNHYSMELAGLPLQPTLPSLIRQTGLRRATARHWHATLSALPAKGLKAEELSESGVLTRLSRLEGDAVLSQAHLLALVDLRHVVPKLVSESRFGFSAQAGWQDCCKRIPPKEFKRRGLLGAGQGMVHVRFRHRSFGWSVIRIRYRDLIAERTDWWSVIDDKGRHVIAGAPGFDSPEDAMKFAELQISHRFDRWGTGQAIAKWERFSLPGGDGYQELLLQVDDWMGTYTPRHYRTRNVLVHIRTSLRITDAGRRVLFLDEVQSDWHADLHAQAKAAAGQQRDVTTPDAPFRKEWPLLTMKLMVWWAQQLGAEGLAWSTPELQRARWRGYGPPEMLYRTVLPDAAKAIARTLGLSLATTAVPVRSKDRQVELSPQGWQVRGPDGVPVTRPFPTRAQAESFADRTGHFVSVDLPVIWIEGLDRITAVPLYGTGTAPDWRARTNRQTPSERAPSDRRGLQNTAIRDGV